MPCPDLTRRAALAGAASAALGALASPALAGAREPVFGDNFAGMALLDQNGQRFAFEPLKGRIVLVHFIFTGCATICPVQTHALAEMRKGLSPAAQARLHIVSVSLDPLSDSPVVLKAYGQRMGVDFSRWSMVTGRPQDIARLVQSLRLLDTAKPAAKPEQHTTRLWLIDPKGRLIQHYPGAPPDSQRLRREIENLHTLHT